MLTPKCKLCRRAGEKLFLKGDRCGTPKCAMIRRAYPPGRHGSKRRRAGSEFGQQLAVKQKIKRVYGILEKQFKKYYQEAKGKTGVTGDLLIQKLESRLDNVMYRSGFASNRVQARQLVRHSHFSVNGKRMNIPSYEVKTGDEIQLKEGKQGKEYYKRIAEALSEKKDVPNWLELDTGKKSVKMKAKPSKDDFAVNADIQMVIEYYSR
ncbi:MAG: 30S ribosomal protein S4 [Patescibacteria group bacterium]|nr:30S ribosomal protein S4 [Patescibacteria group bacterium]